MPLAVDVDLHVAAVERPLRLDEVRELEHGERKRLGHGDGRTDEGMPARLVLVLAVTNGGIIAEPRVALSAPAAGR